MKKSHPQHQAPNITSSVSGEAENAPTADRVEELSFCGLETGAIALLVGCSPSHLNSEYADALAHGRARQQQYLLERLVGQIERNDWSPLRFALKNFLGLSDHPDQAAMQRLHRAPLPDQNCAHSTSLPESPLPSATPMELVPSAPVPEPFTPTAASLPEQKKPPAPVRPRQRPGKQPEGGSPCVPQK